MDKYEQLKLKIDEMKTKTLVAEEMKAFVSLVLKIVKDTKDELADTSKENIKVISDSIAYIKEYHDKTASDISGKSDELLGQMEAKIALLNKTLDKVKKIKATPGKDGKSVDKEEVVAEVMSQIQLPEYKETVLDTPIQLAEKLETLEGEDRLDIKAVKGFENYPTKSDLQMALGSIPRGGGGSGGIEVQKSGVSVGKGSALNFIGSGVTVTNTDGHTTNVSITGSGGGATLQTNGVDNGSQSLLNLKNGSNVTITDDGVGGITIAATGGGTITGSDTQVLFFDGANNPAGEAGMTYDKTNDALTVAGRIITPEIKAVGSAGVYIHNNSGTQVALFGAGGGTGSSLFGTTNIGSASADYIQITGGTGASTFTATGSSTDIDITAVPKGAGKFKVTGNANISGLTASQIMATNASKDLVTLDTATYPSLTELSYVKGVTSAIQTQLNAKGTVSSVAQTFTGGLISVSGSPVTTTGTLALTVAGTSGGIPYFSSASTWASSGVLAANALVKGGGAGVAPSTITTGTGVLTALGVNTGTAGAFVVNGGALGTPSSGTVTNLTGTASININGTVGATTPNTGAFTTLSASSTLTASTTIELGHATDTTLSRVSAGVIAVEGVTIPTISSTSTLTNKTIQAGIIDYVIEPASDDTYEGESTDDKLAGDTIAQWDLVYLDSTSGRWEFADADSATTSGGVLLALAAASGTDGNAMNVVFRGVVRNDGWTWSGAGKALYVSTTAGAMTETAPSGTDDVVRVVGYTLSDDCIYFNPSMDWATVV